MLPLFLPPPTRRFSLGEGGGCGPLSSPLGVTFDPLLLGDSGLFSATRRKLLRIDVRNTPNVSFTVPLLLGDELSGSALASIICGKIKVRGGEEAVRRR